jgi:predicted transcriptional regulator
MVKIGMLAFEVRLLHNKTNRGNFDIKAEILILCEKERTKTSVMYNANLNYAQLKIHLDALISQGLLAKKANNYQTTEKGHRFLELFALLNKLL